MAKRRPLEGGAPGYQKWFASEDGKHYRGLSQDIDSVVRHVDRMDAKINHAPKAGNRSGWEYAGSIPLAVLVDWCRSNGYTMDQWARDEGGIKAKFMAHIQTREFHKLFRKDGRRLR
jgi:hypothetical protein